MAPVPWCQMKENSLTRRGRRLAWAGGGLAVLAALYTVWWFVLADQMAGQLAQGAASARARGWQLALPAPETGGFPGTVRLDLPEVAIAAPDGSWEWQGSRVVVAASPVNPLRVAVTATGPFELALATEKWPLVLSGEVDRATVTVPVLGDPLKAGADLSVRAARLAAPGDEGRLDLDRLDLRVGAPTAEVAGAQAQVWLDLAGLAVTVPDPRPPFDQPLTALTATAVVVGEIPPLADRRRALAAWRDEGGHILVPAAEVVWGDVRIAARGEIRLDAGLQPAAEFVAEIRGVDGLLDMLQATGLVAGTGARFGARMALMALARPSPDDGARVPTVPVRLVEGRLNLGPIPLARFPEIGW